MKDGNEIYDDEILNSDNTGEFQGLGDDNYLPEGVDEDFEFFDDEDEYYGADDEYEDFDDDSEQPDNDGEFAGVSDDDYIDFEDLDFSSISGSKDFKGSFKKLNKQVERSKERKIKKVSVPAGRPIIV